LAVALGIDPPRRPAEECVTLAAAARSLLEELGGETDSEARTVAEAMHRAGWLWAPAVIAALPAGDEEGRERAAGLRVWTRLAEWREQGPGPAPGHERGWPGVAEWRDRAPAPAPGNETVRPEEARSRLAELLGNGAEPRPEQADYAAAAAAALAPRSQ